MFTASSIAPARLLVVYGSKRGSTREVAEVVAETLRDAGFEVDLRPAACSRDTGAYTGVVLGGSIYFGRWHPEVFRFLRQNRRALAALPVAVFALGPRTAEPQDLAESRAQLDRWLAKVPEVEPAAVAVFGGVIDPAGHRFPLNHLQSSDARDWEEIVGWARELAGSLESSARVPVASAR